MVIQYLYQQGGPKEMPRIILFCTIYDNKIFSAELWYLPILLYTWHTRLINDLFSNIYLITSLFSGDLSSKYYRKAFEKHMPM